MQRKKEVIIEIGETQIQHSQGHHHHLPGVWFCCWVWAPIIMIIANYNRETGFRDN